MMNKAKSLLRRFSLFALALVVMAPFALATEPTPIPTPSYDYSEITAGMATGMNSMVSSLIPTLVPVVLAGLAIFGVMLTIRVGKAVFNRMTGRM